MLNITLCKFEEKEKRERERERIIPGGHEHMYCMYCITP